MPDDAALKITGSVETEVGWTEDKIRSMDTIEAESTNKEGETKTYTGVRISDLLSKAVPTSGATTVVFVADDGYTRRGASGRDRGLRRLHRLLPQPGRL